MNDKSCEEKYMQGNSSEIPKLTHITEADKLSLELAKANRETALAEANTALAKNELAALQYKYLVLQLYMKYKLSSSDALTEQGEILYDEALKEQGSKV